MLDLLKMAMKRPLQAVVVALCVVTISVHLGLFEIKEAVAVLQEQQNEDKNVGVLVYRMNETLIRVDANVKSLKEQLNRENNYALKK